MDTVDRTHALRGALAELVRTELGALPITDLHTHLFDPAMGDLLLSGVDELLTYHYHVAELFRACPGLSPEEFFALPRPAQADLVWRELFVERSPLSEVGRAVCELWSRFGIDPRATDLRQAREAFAALPPGERVDRTFRLAGLGAVCMTNDPLDAAERAVWDRGFERDPRFHAALRLDSAIMAGAAGAAELRALGYDVDPVGGARSAAELRRYLCDWHRRIDARYMAVSLPPELGYPGGDAPWLRMLVESVLPAARELGTPVALMIGVRRGVQPRLRLAGDGLGAIDVAELERLVHDHGDVQFLVTTLTRESQHALCVAARKLANLTPFGCWWFLNNRPSVEEITRLRLDLLGPTFVPQHSDARVLEQLVFKWSRSRDWLADPLCERYSELDAAGYTVTPELIRRDLRALFPPEPYRRG
ncbi:MAG: glucuronate isomerase [Planctomycetes bacterium]|nr:glucuronate isomerase [Planctomycetota bacterium]